MFSPIFSWFKKFYIKDQVINTEKMLPITSADSGGFELTADPTQLGLNLQVQPLTKPHNKSKKAPDKCIQRELLLENDTDAYNKFKRTHQKKQSELELGYTLIDHKKINQPKRLRS